MMFAYLHLRDTGGPTISDLELPIDTMSLSICIRLADLLSGLAVRPLVTLCTLGGFLYLV